MHSAEEIVQKTYTGLEVFLQKNLSAEAFQDVSSYTQQMFPTWNHLWQQVEPWLRQHQFQNIRDTIFSFTKTFNNVPPSFQSDLQNSLALHDLFWNQVFQNLVVAKSRLP